MDWLAPAGTASTITAAIFAGILQWRKENRDGRVTAVDLTERLQSMLDRAMAHAQEALEHAEAEIGALNKRVLALEEDRAAQARRIEAHLVWDREVESRLRGFDPAATFGPPPPLHP